MHHQWPPNTTNIVLTGRINCQTVCVVTHYISTKIFIYKRLSVQGDVKLYTDHWSLLDDERRKLSIRNFRYPSYLTIPAVISRTRQSGPAFGQTAVSWQCSSAAGDRPRSLPRVSVPAGLPTLNPKSLAKSRAVHSQPSHSAQQAAKLQGRHRCDVFIPFLCIREPGEVGIGFFVEFLHPVYGLVNLSDEVLLGLE